MSHSPETRCRQTSKQSQRTSRTLGSEEEDDDDDEAGSGEFSPMRSLASASRKEAGAAAAAGPWWSLSSPLNCSRFDRDGADPLLLLLLRC